VCDSALSSAWAQSGVAAQSKLDDLTADSRWARVARGRHAIAGATAQRRASGRARRARWRRWRRGGGPLLCGTVCEAGAVPTATGDGRRQAGRQADRGWGRTARRCGAVRWKQKVRKRINRPCRPDCARGYKRERSRPSCPSIYPARRAGRWPAAPRAVLDGHEQTAVCLARRLLAHARPRPSLCAV